MIGRVLATVRGLLAIGLLVGFYLLAITLVLLYLGFIVLFLTTMAQSEVTTTNFATPVLVAAGSLPVLIGIVRGVLSVSSSSSRPERTVLVTRAEAPLLWRTVEELAQRAGAPVPDEIHLTAEANAGVVEETRMLGLVLVERRMYLGLPLLVGLPLDELKAVLCHELGHYAGGHNRFGGVVYRGAVALDTAMEDMRRTVNSNNLARMYAGLWFGVVRAYAWGYARIAFAVLRRQEVEADRAAAAVAGGAVTGEALRSTIVLMTAWADFRDRFLTPLAAAGAVPDDPFRAFETMLADPDYRDVLARRRSAPPESGRTVLDTHPSLAERLARLRELPAVDGPRELRPALSLLGADPGELCLLLGAEMAPPETVRTPWRQWLALASGSHVETAVAWLRPAVRALTGARRLTINAALDLLEAGRGAELAARTAREAGLPPDRGEDLLHAALTGLLGAALVRAGSASWTAPWTGTPGLIVRDPAVELTDLVRRALASPREVSRLRLHLAVLGVDVHRERPPSPAGRDGGGPTEVRLGLADPVERARGKRSRNLSLWTMGVVTTGLVLAVFVFREEPRPVRSPVTYNPFATRTFVPPVVPPFLTWRVPLPTHLVPPRLTIPVPSLAPVPSMAPIPPGRASR
ncbi:Zn-dependent protease with chaperone function [Crossiella equi]|uniref:Zn-dependent protease with chaperone function n=1 Tax=Crossiella equi TaxID=130796 RepID=A0ABS5ANH4_9PSEU|nr:M48 family metallopeptidase [Crossiella equi]MBP2478117.1 Zn-dependent protease with chaperone function [Crossiella equi]